MKTQEIQRRKFLKTRRKYGLKRWVAEFEFTAPVDAKRVYVYDGSHTIFELNTGDFAALIDGMETTYSTLTEAESELWDEFNHYECYGL